MIQVGETNSRPLENSAFRAPSSQFKKPFPSPKRCRVARSDPERSRGVHLRFHRVKKETFRLWKHSDMTWDFGESAGEASRKDRREREGGGLL